MKRLAVATLWVIAILGLLALGTWQVRRLAWKRMLIAQVEARLAASPVSAPRNVGPDDAYMRVAAAGVFERGKDSFVQASTVQGPGWWVLTPLRTAEGRAILINRGFVPRRVTVPPPKGQVRVTGLLRLTEPEGGFLRSNDPAADRWYSRDVATIAARRGLGDAARYFIDADRGVPGGPIGGLTVVRFANNHLPYAITWYILAIMASAGLIYWWRHDRSAP